MILVQFPAGRHLILCGSLPFTVVQSSFWAQTVVTRHWGEKRIFTAFDQEIYLHSNACSTHMSCFSCIIQISWICIWLNAMLYLNGNIYYIYVCVCVCTCECVSACYRSLRIFLILYSEVRTAHELNQSSTAHAEWHTWMRMLSPLRS